MFTTVRRLGLLAIAFAGLFCTTGFAQEKKEGGGGGGYAAILDNLDMLIDNYAKFLGRKYDLTEEQYNFTVDLLRQKADAFIQKHDGDIRDLFNQMFEARSGGSMSPEQLVEWGKRVAPIYDEAKKIVTDGNDEWRAVLDDRQKALHDADLKLMKQSFEKTDEQLHRIVSGEMSVDEFVNPNRPRARRPDRPTNTTPESGQPITRKQMVTPGNTPPAPPKGDGSLTPEQAEEQAKLQALAAEHEKQAALEAAHAAAEARQREENGEAPQNSPGAEPAPDAPQPGAQPAEAPDPNNRGHERRGERGSKVSEKNFESEWQKYVREFIDKYRLNEQQSQKANLLLGEAENRARQTVSSKETELARIDKRETELKAATTGRGKEKDNPSAKELAELARKREAIIAPLGKLFDELKEKLEKLPTRAQRKAADDAARKSTRPGAKPEVKSGKPK